MFITCLDRVCVSLAITLLVCAPAIRANTPLKDADFEEKSGIEAAKAAAPMWYMPKGTCFPSAAEDGKGNQTHGLPPSNCNTLFYPMDDDCPQPPVWTGPQTAYYNISDEPFETIPTYYNASYCAQDRTYRVLYYVYFKKDNGHKSDWAGTVILFSDIEKRDQWRRHSIILSDLDYSKITYPWDDINDTFDGADDWKRYKVKGRNHPKLYFGKFHHSVHKGWYTTAFKHTCPPTAAVEYRNDDYQFWARNHLRHADVLDPTWDWGHQSDPTKIDICEYGKKGVPKG